MDLHDFENKTLLTCEEENILNSTFLKFISVWW